jgi:hypothetical protein
MNSEFKTDKIIDRQSFAEFLERLQQDFITNSHAWENKTIPDFLEAMGRYAEDIQGYYDNTNQNINADLASWKLFADIFEGAKIYE